MAERLNSRVKNERLRFFALGNRIGCDMLGGLCCVGQSGWRSFMCIKVQPFSVSFHVREPKPRIVVFKILQILEFYAERTKLKIM